MDCCSTDKNSKKKVSDCTSCSQIGSTVKLETLKSLLTEESAKNIDGNLSYRYCKNSDCEVAYYSQSSGQYFKVENLKVKATHKDQGLEVNVCYCFGYTRKKVLEEIRSTGQSNIVQEIKSKMKDIGCRCEISNPQGSCCLGNVTAWVKHASKLR